MSTAGMPMLTVGFIMVALLEISLIKAMKLAVHIEPSSHSRAAPLVKVAIRILDVFFHPQSHGPTVVKTILAWEAFKQFSMAMVAKHGNHDLAFHDNVIAYSLIAFVAVLYALLEERYSRLNVRLSIEKNLSRRRR